MHRAYNITLTINNVNKQAAQIMYIHINIQKQYQHQLQHESL